MMNTSIDLEWLTSICIMDASELILAFATSTIATADGCLPCHYSAWFGGEPEAGIIVHRLLAESWS